MAKEQKKKTSAASAKKGSATKRSTTATVASSKGKNTKEAARLSREEQAKLNKIKSEQKTAAAARRKNFSEQYMPYIMGAVGLLLLVFFTVHLICGEAGPSEHWMGPVGYWFSYFFYGLFGWPAYCIPLLLIYLAIFWRKNCREETVVLRSVLSVVLMVLISAVVHVFSCAADESLAEFDLILYFTSGAEFTGGGFVGGMLGFLLYHGLKVWGTILVSVLVFPLLIMFLVGVTPAYVGSLIKAQIAASREAKAERDAEDARAALEAHDVPAPTKKRKLKEAPMPDEDEEEAYVPPRHKKTAETETAKPASVKKDKPARAETLLVNARTGEVMDDEYTEDARAEADDEPDEEAYVPPKAIRNKKATLTEEVSADSDDTEKDLRVNDDAEALPQGKAQADDTADEGNELYIPQRRSFSDRREAKARPAHVSRCRDDDEFASDDTHEDMETLEISWNDEADGGNETVATAARSVQSSPSGNSAEPEKFVVVVNRQETAAVTSTTDHQIDGLPDEEIVLPSAMEDVTEEEKKEYTFPPIDLLIPGPKRYEADENEIVRNTHKLRHVLESFHIRVKEIACSCGPTITRYEVKPDTGVRVRSIANLVDDIALGLAKSGVRIEAPIPGKDAVGIEVPNDRASTVALRNLIEAPEFMNHKSRLAACLGADVAGSPVMMDINKMPHLLVAGTTGSGKSVCINSIIMSILYKAKPDEVKLILIDPKKVEFAVYRDLPHLYCPLISDPKKAAGALNSAVVEMERRFELIEEVGVRNLAGYNELTAGDPERPPLPQMVIIIDELADLMMTASNEVETAICRLAQKARAAGIHLILGTQRPSVDVITGLIKANIPSRIAFTVSAAVDSRTIIDTVGAEKLIGRGDMLYAPVGCNKPMRVQGTFVSDGEVEKVVSFLKEHNEQIEYDESFMHLIEVEAAKCGQGKKKGGDVGNIEDFSALGGDDEDGKFWAAVEVAVDAEKISTSLLQRRLNLGYGRAAKIIDRMEEMGFVGPADGNKPRKLLITKSDLAEIRISGRAEGSGDE
ncbi:MAG: DNA translocase FtsK [Clostridia bacterium]|nr:DNA translocase FtsK [Clostridia bacterium]